MSSWKAGYWLLLALPVLTADPCLAGPGCCGSAPSSPSRPAKGASVSENWASFTGMFKPAKAPVPKPYGGQKRCPVCEGDLTAKDSVVSVDASLTTQPNKTFMQKIGLAKPASPQKLSYFVCGPECAAHAQEKPEAFLANVIAARGAGQ